MPLSFILRWRLSCHPRVLSMRLTDFERARVSLLLERYCSNKPVQADTPRLRFSFAIRGTFVTLLKERTNSRRPDAWLQIPFAQFRRERTSSVWTLYSRDRARRWLLYDPIPASKRLDFLLQVVEANPCATFLG